MWDLLLEPQVLHLMGYLLLGNWEFVRKKRGGRGIKSIFPSRVTVQPQLSTEICLLGTFFSELW